MEGVSASVWRRWRTALGANWPLFGVLQEDEAAIRLGEDGEQAFEDFRQHVLEVEGGAEVAGDFEDGPQLGLRFDLQATRPGHGEGGGGASRRGSLAPDGLKRDGQAGDVDAVAGRSGVRWWMRAPLTKTPLTLSRSSMW